MVLEGSVTLKIDRKSYPLEEKDVYLVDPMEPHEFVSGGNGVLLLAIQLSPQLIEPIFPGAANIRFLGSTDLRECFQCAPQRYLILRALCVELTYSYLERRPNYEFKCFSLAAALFHLLHATF